MSCRVNKSRHLRGGVSVLISILKSLKICTADDADSRREHSSGHGDAKRSISAPSPYSLSKKKYNHVPAIDPQHKVKILRLGNIKNWVSQPKFQRVIRIAFVS